MRSRGRTCWALAQSVRYMSPLGVALSSEFATSLISTQPSVCLGVCPHPLSKHRFVHRVSYLHLMESWSLRFRVVVGMETGGFAAEARIVASPLHIRIRSTKQSVLKATCYLRPVPSFGCQIGLCRTRSLLHTSCPSAHRGRAMKGRTEVNMTNVAIAPPPPSPQQTLKTFMGPS